VTATSPRQDQDRLARTALTWLAEPADPHLVTLLSLCKPAMILAGIRQGLVPRPYRMRGNADLTAIRQAMRQAMRRWQARLPGLPDEDEIPRACPAGRLRVICPGDPEWPARLDDLSDARPYALWLHGTGDLRSRTHQAVTVTGSRAATGYGAHVAGRIAQDLAGHGRVTTSGAAYGIDAAVHRGTLTAGGLTVAVLASGIDQPYPAGHTDLSTRIADGGLMISEWPPGTRPTRTRFQARNRVLAALGHGTVVVEAGEHSGALTVARHARELGRLLMAVPGPVTSAQSAGCHLLIRDQDAVLITSASDIITAAAMAQGPDTVNGLPVIALRARKTRHGELPDQWYVVCADESREPGRQHIVRTAAFDPQYQGGQWAAGNGRYNLPYERALTIMRERTDGD
jgi:DNA processing protein